MIQDTFWHTIAFDVAGCGLRAKKPYIPQCTSRNEKGKTMEPETITIKGNPQGYQMPRARMQISKQTKMVQCERCKAWISQRKSFAMMYDAQASIKKGFRLVVMASAPPVLIQNPCVLWIHAYFPIPKATPKWKLPLMKAGWIRPGVKPDTTNILKLYEDAFSGIWFCDDALVVTTHAKKTYDPNPRIEIQVKELLDFGNMKKEEAYRIMQQEGIVL